MPLNTALMAITVLAKWAWGSVWSVAGQRWIVSPSLMVAVGACVAFHIASLKASVGIRSDGGWVTDVSVGLISVVFSADVWLASVFGCVSVGLLRRTFVGHRQGGRVLVLVLRGVRQRSGIFMCPWGVGAYSGF